MLVLQMLGGALLLIGSVLVIGTVFVLDAPRSAQRAKVTKLLRPHVMPERRAA